MRGPLGANWGGAKWCNEPPNLEKGASLVPEGVPRGPRSPPPGPPKAPPEVDFGVILDEIWEVFWVDLGRISLHFSTLEK